MTRLSDQSLLQVWDGVEAAGPAARPAELLDALRTALGEETGTPAAGLPVGRRDRALIALRRRLFGAGMTCHAPCPACGEAIEVTLDLDAFGPGGRTRDAVEVRHGGHLHRLRPATSRDLAAAVARPPAERIAALIRACALGPLPDPLPPGFVEAASEALRTADPDAEIRVALTCPDCGTAADLDFDIGACLAEDIRRAARRLLREIHHLASAYGWSEAECLAVPARRRRDYILIGSG